MLSRWELTDKERDKYIDALKDNLAGFRMKAGVSQGELCNIIGISRQTYSAIETGRKRMMWPTYLTLIYFFDSIRETRDLLRGSSAYPKEVLDRLNDGKSLEPGLLELNDLNEIVKDLDDQALHSIRTMLLVEYARCRKLPGDVVVKAYDGGGLFDTSQDRATEIALMNIRNKKK